jgi:hypothetical protein
MHLTEIVHKSAVSPKLSVCFYTFFWVIPSILTIGQTFTDAVPPKSYFPSISRGAMNYNNNCTVTADAATLGRGVVTKGQWFKDGGLGCLKVKAVH